MANSDIPLCDLASLNWASHRVPSSPASKMHSWENSLRQKNPTKQFKSQVRILHLFRWFTHTPQQRGFLRLRQMRWRWKWKGNGNEMTMKMRWQLLNRDTRRGTQKRKGRGETPTPTHLAQSGQTLKGQGERKSGRTTGQTPTRGGRVGGSAWHNLQGESQTYLRTRRTQTWPREGEAWDRGPMGS